MPATAVALLIALSMVPGHIYLQLTTAVRRPSARTSLSELLETITVGLATTGVACTAFLLLAPDHALRVIQTVRSTPAAIQADEVRGAALLAGLLLLSAVVLAVLSAWGVRALAKNRFAPSVMQATLGLRKPSHGRAVGIELVDGSTIDGLLHAYTLTDEEADRTIALKRPLRRMAPSGEVSDLPFDYIVTFGANIKHVVMNQVHDPGTTPRQGRRKLRVRVVLE